MSKRSYVISGIKPAMAEVWYKELKGEEVRFFVDPKTCEYSIKISLSIFEAIRARIEMIGYNIGRRHKLKFKKYRGRRYGV